MVDSKILDKIKKCLALSQSPEAHEAAAALRQAQKLMEMHGISQIDLKMSDVGEVKVNSAVSVSRLKDWETALVSTVGKAFGCKLMWTRSSSYAENVYGSFTMVGLKSQLELAEYTVKVMQRKVVKARAEFVNSLPSYYTRKDKTVQADGFCKGWVAEIQKTVMAFAMNKETEELLDERLVQLGSRGKAKVQQRMAGADGYAAGRQAAAGESIHRPMSTARPTLAIGR